MIKWDSTYAIDYEEIDMQHHLFFNLCNKVGEAIKQNAPKDWAMRLLLEIQRYAAFHFTSEENVMIQFHYPGLQEHRTHHDMLLSSFRDKVNAYEFGETDLKEIDEFLFEWLALHITNEDKKFGKFILETTGSGLPATA